MNPEFYRVLSLIIQRYDKGNDINKAMYKQMLNCIDIQYANLQQEGVEGMFYFDRTQSTTKHLTIDVDASYRSYDDLSTAILLSHELTHAKQFVEYIVYKKETECIDAEVEAYKQQIFFQSYLNDEEAKSLIARAEKETNTNSQLEIFKELIFLSGRVAQNCRQSTVNSITEGEKLCFTTQLDSQIRQFVADNQVYQKQCATK